MDAGTTPLLPTREASALFARIAGNIETVMRGSHDAVRKLLAAFASGGHVLIEDYPGTGKTTLAKSLAALASCDDILISSCPLFEPCAGSFSIPTWSASRSVRGRMPTSWRGSAPSG